MYTLLVNLYMWEWSSKLFLWRTGANSKTADATAGNILPSLPLFSISLPTPSPIAQVFFWLPPPSNLYSVAVCFQTLACSPPSLLDMVFQRPLYTHWPSAGPGPCYPQASPRSFHSRTPFLGPQPRSKPQAATYVGNCIVKTYQYKNVPWNVI